MEARKKVDRTFMNDEMILIVANINAEICTGKYQCTPPQTMQGYRITLLITAGYHSDFQKPGRSAPQMRHMKTLLSLSE